jgi:hypothetical protein
VKLWLQEFSDSRGYNIENEYMVMGRLPEQVGKDSASRLETAGGILGWCLMIALWLNLAVNSLFSGLDYSTFFAALESL